MKNLFTTTQPAWMNSVTVIFFITTVTVFTVWKTILIARYAKEDNNTSLENFMKLPEIYNLMVDCGITMLTLIVLLIFLGFKLGTMWVFLPGSFFYIGISLFICGDMYSIVEYRDLAILTFAFAIITAIFMKSNFLIWLSASYAIYFALLAITLLFTGRDLHLKKD